MLTSKKLNYEQLIEKNREEILKDTTSIDEIEERLEQKHQKNIVLQVSGIDK